jgi:MATE family multidrug resistance protein
LRLTATLCAPAFHREFASRATWAPDRGKLLNIFRVGGPTGLQWCSDVAVWAIFIAVLVGSYFGKDHQLATNAAWQYLRISFLPCVGIGMALSALVGKAVGARDLDRAVRVTRIAAGLALAYMGTLSVCFFVWRRGLIGVFTDDPDVIRIGSAVMVCAAIFQVFDALGISYNSALKGAGDTFVPAVVFIVSHWLVVVGGGFALAELRPDLGSMGPWIAASVLIIVTGIYQWFRWHQGAWTKIDVFKHDRGAMRREPAGALSSASASRVAEGPTSGRRSLAEQTHCGDV